MLVDTPEIDAATRIDAVTALAVSLGDAEAVRQFDRIVRANPNDWEAVEPYLDWLREHHRWGEVRDVAARYLDAGADKTGLGPTLAVVAIAEALREQGHPDRAWEALQELHSTQAGAMHEGARGNVAWTIYNAATKAASRPAWENICWNRDGFETRRLRSHPSHVPSSDFSLAGSRAPELVSDF